MTFHLLGMESSQLTFKHTFFLQRGRVETTNQLYTGDSSPLGIMVAKGKSIGNCRLSVVLFRQRKALSVSLSATIFIRSSSSDRSEIWGSFRCWNRME